MKEKMAKIITQFKSDRTRQTKPKKELLNSKTQDQNATSEHDLSFEEKDLEETQQNRTSKRKGKRKGKK